MIILDLPPELREKIYQYCPLDDLKRMYLCSRDAAVKPILWTCVKLSGIDLVREDFPKDKRLENLKFSSKLTINGRSSHGKTLGENFLEKITSNFNTLISLCKIKILKVCFLPVHLNGGFGKMRYLRELIMLQPEIDDSLLQLVCDNLLELRLLNLMMFSWYSPNARSITPQGTNYLKNLKSLKELTLNCKFKFNTTVCRNISEVNTLQVLDFESVTMDCFDFSCFKNLPRLKELYLRRLPVRETGIESIVRHVKYLKVLDISASHITDVTAHLLKKLFLLEKLNVSTTRLYDTGMAEICQIKTLTVLFAYNCPNLTDFSLYHISTMPNLRVLNVDCNHFTENGTTYLTEMDSLKTLYLTNTLHRDLIKKIASNTGGNVSCSQECFRFNGEYPSGIGGHVINED